MRTIATLALLLGAAPLGRAAITISISDDGTDLTMTATGFFDNTGVTEDGSGVEFPHNAVVASDDKIYAFSGAMGGYTVTSSGTLSGNNFAVTDSGITVNIPVTLSLTDASISFGALSGTLNNTAIFSNTTLASMGMVAGESVSFTWGGGGANRSGVIRTLPVPEPSALLLSTLGALALLRRKR